MIDKKRPMGRGLSAILGSESRQAQNANDKGAKEIIGNIIELPIEDIFANPKQPRTQFDPTALNQLAQSILELGIIQPITVRKVGDKFEIISGERRFRASQIANLKKIPAFVRIANDKELLEMALVENIQREDLDAIEVALTYQRLIEEINITQDELSRRVGKERSSITNYIRLLKLHPTIQTAIRDGVISMGHGRALLGLESLEMQLDIFKQVKNNKLSVRDTEKVVNDLKNIGNEFGNKPTKVKLSENFLQGKSKLENILSVPVNIKANNKGKGSISIQFKNEEEFNQLLTKLNQ